MPPPPPRIHVRSFLSRMRANPPGATLLKSSPPTMTLPRMLIFMGKSFVFAHLFISYVGTIGSTEGISMVPTISHSYITRPWILESRLHRRGRNIHVGDVITFTHPINPAERACKRVVGMPGDFVSVITPGRKDEDLDKEGVEGDWASVSDELVRVPEGHCWVAGDNLEWSRDSRVFGALPLGLVRAKVLGVVWPWSEFKWFGSGLENFERGQHEWVVR